MLTRNALPLVNLSKNHDSAAIRQALLSFGAFRLAIPWNTQHLSKEVFQKARAFFKHAGEIKQNTRGYSAFSTELVRGETPIPKESIYFFRKDTQQKILCDPPQDFSRSVTLLHNEWKLARKSLFNMLSDMLNPKVQLTGTESLDYESLGVHHYDSQQLDHNGDEFSPAHMDSGTLTILFRDSDGGDDMLEVANLDTTGKSDSKGVGLEASFIPVTAASNEAVVLAGIRLQRLLNKDQVRACVHRVRGPVQQAARRKPMNRLSIAIFCAPSVV